IVTHNIGVAAYMADQLVVMQYGKVVDRGTRDDVMKHPTNDYTKNLLAAVPEMEGKRYVS
ncbi:MAG: ABC transporter ATP-binding protein, partial [Lachnospiraceae bacterium]|nr:ABC transporter ATP-binding protein [Lachnospiraceae bacterium]